MTSLKDGSGKIPPFPYIPPGVKPLIQFVPVVYVQIDFQECHRLSSSVFDRLVLKNTQQKTGGMRLKK